MRSRLYIPTDWAAHPIHLGLDRIRVLLREIGVDPSRLPAILVAGTNGKGSTCTFIDAILRAHGLRTGLYTSPHLWMSTERIRISGQPVAMHRLARTWARVVECADRIVRTGAIAEPPTYFELLTAAAFHIFQNAMLDGVILEVGLGGRYDATNIADARVTAITHIDFDHQHYLGWTLAAIAEEKFGIVRAGVPLVTAERRNWLVRQWAQRLAAMGSRMIHVFRDTRIDRRHYYGHFRIRAWTDQWALNEWTPLGLAGAHQVENALVALWTTWLWCRARSTPWDPDRVRTALMHTRLPGRLEWWHSPDDRFCLLDGAHNPDGIRACRAYLSVQPMRR